MYFINLRLNIDSLRASKHFRLMGRFGAPRELMLKCLNWQDYTVPRLGAMPDNAC